MSEDPFGQTIDALVSGAPYAMTQSEKEQYLLPLVRERARRLAEGCPPYARFLDRLGGAPGSWRRLADVPPLPVSMFKRFRLSAVGREEIVRELHSSSTTGDEPSRIFVDKPTAFRQARALAAILRDRIGGRRRPFLVLDAPGTAQEADTLGARGAAIRGIATFASGTSYAMRAGSAGDLVPDFESVGRFLERHGDAPLLVFGFTYIVWTRFVEEAEQRGLRFRAPHGILLHSGGWKKLTARAVSKEAFRERTAAALGMPEGSVLDFYGMIEQVGTVFVDCEAGRKHAPAFADVIVRRPHTMEPAGPGEEGILEVLSVLPSSYPGLALLTEDEGSLVGVDDCPCGRLGTSFRFTRRVEKAAIRGCGDTFAAARGSA